MNRPYVLLLVALLEISATGCQLIAKFDKDKIPKGNSGPCLSADGSACKATCGNGVIEPGESCDPKSSCPTSCDDGNACTSDTMVGSADTCDLSCKQEVIEKCLYGDGCCPPGCNVGNDNDCSSTCGNGVVTFPETCDKAIAAGRPGACPATCNDGNACTVDSSTGSTTNCNVVCVHQTISGCADDDMCCPPGCSVSNDNDWSASCGDGVVAFPETCDYAIAAGQPGACPTTCDDGNTCTIDGVTGSAANCNVACRYQSITQCRNSDGCCPAGCHAGNDNDCSSTCGNGVVDFPETCDYAIGAGLPGACPASCDDDDVCTIDVSTGSNDNCGPVCTHHPNVECANGDGCCPTGCSSDNDNDCRTTGEKNKFDNNPAQQTANRGEGFALLARLGYNFGVAKGTTEIVRLG
jgi:hypothetical protein